MKPYYDEGGITIYHGDCREVLPQLGQGCVDLILTDPPYGVDHESHHGGMGGIVGDDGGLDVLGCLDSACHALRHDRHIYAFGPHDLSELTFASMTELVWDKGKFGGGDLGLPWGPQHERITFAVWNPYPSMKGRGEVAARLRRGSVLRVPKQNNGKGALTHPTEKPVLLMRHLIEASSTFGETVLDPFMGSGATLVAARMEGRRAIGIEVEERYCEIAVERLAQGVFDLEAA